MKKLVRCIYFDLRILGPHLIVPFSGIAAVAAYLVLISRSFTLVPFEFLLPLLSVWTGVFLVEPMFDRCGGEVLWTYPLKTVSCGLYPMCRSFIYHELLLLLLCSTVRICFPIQWGSLFLLMTIQSLFMNAVAFFLLAVSGECTIPLFGCVLYQLASWTLRDIFPEHLSIYLLSDALPELSRILLKGMNAIPIAIALAIAGVNLFSFRTMRRE